MKTVIIKIPSKDVFFRRYTEVMSGIMDVRGKEREILMWLLYYYDEMKNDQQRDEKIFSSNIRKMICKNAGISMASLNNCICSLRYRGIVSGTGHDSRINTKYIVSYSDSYDILFKLIKS